MIKIAKHFRSASALLAVATILSACATGDFSGYGGSQGDARAEREARNGRYADRIVAIANWRCDDEKRALYQSLNPLFR